MRLTVIMPSLLEEYPGCASDRVAKFKRAVRSCLDQDYSDVELIVIADGCPTTGTVLSDILFSYPLAHATNLYNREKKTVFEGNIQSAMLFRIASGKRVVFISLERQPAVFSGNVRNEAHAWSTGDVICYLDTDDIFMPGHLSFIATAFKGSKIDMAIFNDYVSTQKMGELDVNNKRMRGANCSPGCIGASSLAHHSSLVTAWPDGYGHDFHFAESLFKQSKNNKHIGNGNYLVCHIPNQVDI